MSLVGVVGDESSGWTVCVFMRWHMVLKKQPQQGLVAVGDGRDRGLVSSLDRVFVFSLHTG